MSKTAARFSLADISRATRAAKEQGAEAVEILCDGTIRIRLVIKVEKEDAAQKAEPQFRDFKL
jgi:hypothetical protein